MADYGAVLALCDGVLTVHHRHSHNRGSADVHIGQCAGACARQHNMLDSALTAGATSLQVCVAKKKKIILFGWHDGDLKQV